MKLSITKTIKLLPVALFSFCNIAFAKDKLPVNESANQKIKNQTGILGKMFATSYSGEATALQVSLLGGTPTKVSGTGPLAPTGGSQNATLLEHSVPGLLSAEVLHASTVGQGDRSRSEASVAKLNLATGGNTITADFLRSATMAVCSGNTAAISGNSEIANLSINGQNIAVSGAPNQTIDLPAGAGKVIINEQVRSGSGNSGSITVNALHIIVNGVADVIVASSHADITCAGRDCTGKDFVTGGGWITAPSGSKGTFAVAGGLKNGFWGHLTYIDHGGNLKVKGTGVTAYTIISPTTRKIDGTCEINGKPGTYSVTVSDNGEPGRGKDVFDLTLSNGYKASGTLAGGNIQLHSPCK